MNPAHLLVLAAVCVSLLGASSIPPQALNLNQFRLMIKCTNDRVWADFMDYGCYCVARDSNTPVDDLDRCCQAQKQCYDEAVKVHGCKPLVMFYSFECRYLASDLDCSGNNTKCRNFVCNCDRTATLCILTATYNRNNHKIDPSRCQ
uniref:Phospholipase A2 9b n=1 Tax=Micrurus tener TaxID=1114301 RepID=A0A194AP59_9SAUR